MFITLREDESLVSWGNTAYGTISKNYLSSVSREHTIVNIYPVFSAKGFIVVREDRDGKKDTVYLGKILEFMPEI